MENLGEMRKTDMEMKGWVKSLVEEIDLDDEEEEEIKNEMINKEKRMRKTGEGINELEELDVEALDSVLKGLPAADFDFGF